MFTTPALPAEIEVEQTGPELLGAHEEAIVDDLEIRAVGADIDEGRTIPVLGGDVDALPDEAVAARGQGGDLAAGTGGAGGGVEA